MSTSIIGIGPKHSQLAIFANDTIVTVQSIPTSEIHNILAKYLDAKKPSHIFIGSEEREILSDLETIIHLSSIPIIRLDRSSLSIKGDIDKPNQISLHTLANLYGALHHFPLNDCLVIDISKETSFDFVTQQGYHLGGASLPKFTTSDSPQPWLIKPECAIQKNQQIRLQTGIYYGMLGSIERISAEICLTADSPSSVKILATGTAIEATGKIDNEKTPDLINDLTDIVDTIDPHLSLWGLYEIFKEHLSNIQEK